MMRNFSESESEPIHSFRPEPLLFCVLQPPYTHSLSFLGAYDNPIYLIYGDEQMPTPIDVLIPAIEKDLATLPHMIDADTVLIRPHVFKTGDKTVFYCRNWSLPEYSRTYKKLMGKSRSAKLSFVTHYLLFEKAKVKQLKQAIESKHNTSWHSAIMRSMNKSKQFAFSEFETHGNFLYSSEPEMMILKQAKNKSLHLSFPQISRSKMSSLIKTYRSILFTNVKGILNLPRLLPNEAL